MKNDAQAAADAIKDRRRPLRSPRPDPWVKVHEARKVTDAALARLAATR